MARNGNSYLRLPSDPCVCGDFTTWHPTCYEGVSRAEILEKHKEHVADFLRRERAKALGHVRNVCGW